MCICFLIALQLKIFMWHSPVGCWGCYKVVSEHKSIFWSSMAWPGWSRMLQAQVNCTMYILESLMQLCMCHVKKVFNEGFMVPRTPYQF
jgi:hypothetical protein